MIIDVLIGLYYLFGKFLVWVLPSIAIPTEILAGINEGLEAMIPLEITFPFLAVLVKCFGFMLVIEFGILTFNMVMGAWAFMRGSGKPEL